MLLPRIALGRSHQPPQKSNNAARKPHFRPISSSVFNHRDLHFGGRRHACRHRLCPPKESCSRLSRLSPAADQRSINITSRGRNAKSKFEGGSPERSDPRETVASTRQKPLVRVRVRACRGPDCGQTDETNQENKQMPNTPLQLPSIMVFPVLLCIYTRRCSGSFWPLQPANMRRHRLRPISKTSPAPPTTGIPVPPVQRGRPPSTQ